MLRNCFVLVGVLLVVARGALALGDDTMVCGSKLVKVGDSRETVLKKCGEPASRREVMRRGDGYTQEVWIYDFGRRKFQRHLFFDGDELTSVMVVK